VRSAIAQGLLPDGAMAPAVEPRPWPVVLLTALGAWLAAIPLFVVIGLLFGDLLNGALGPYLIGALLLAAAIVVLRSRSVPLFVEQLAVVAMLIGGGALGVGFFRDLGEQGGAAVLALIALLTAVLVSRPWLRALLGAAAALSLFIASTPVGFNSSRGSDWTAWHVCLALWLVAGCTQHMVLNSGATARTASALESVSAGWLLTTLIGLATWSGMTFLAAGVLGGIGGGVGDSGLIVAGNQSSAMQIVSVLLALVAALWIARHWLATRSPWHAGVASVLMALAWFMPNLGAVWLALAVCATTQRWRLAATAALVASWVVGSFYYQLAWPLVTKALVMMLAGVVLGGLAWMASRAAVWQSSRPIESRFGAPQPLAPAMGRAVCIALTAIAVVAVANVGIWQKESVIASGQAVFIELAPVDPRSLMQGDFMRLRFVLPAEVEGQLDGLLLATRPKVIASRNPRGIATIERMETEADRQTIDVRKDNPGLTEVEYAAMGEGKPLQDHELRIELTPKDGHWIVVTDAWYFKEGEAERWAKAKYGEFRVDEAGRALLVGLRGAQLEAL
jgi:uncharacterized membrane-anchored protein